ncbi:hypothetical protein TYRP_000508 [Tyrophagus putrescentiae]|nr:hypothetical protein TYRP_000508 [Tyrophagus putrescentiae]
MYDVPSKALARLPLNCPIQMAIETLATTNANKPYMALYNCLRCRRSTQEAMSPGHRSALD